MVFMNIYINLHFMPASTRLCEWSVCVRGTRKKDEETEESGGRGEAGARNEPASAEKKDQSESTGFIQATKKVPAMKNLDNNLHRRAAERLRRNRFFVFGDRQTLPLSNRVRGEGTRFSKFSSPPRRTLASTFPPILLAKPRDSPAATITITISRSECE